MMRTCTRTIALMGVAAVVATACSSSKSSSGSGGPGGTGAPTSASSVAATNGAGKTITVGVLTDVTGLAASGEAHIEDGVKAGVYAAAKDGYTIKYVVADSQTSPSAVLTAAKKLVAQDHVDVVLGASALLFGQRPT